jgi:hypothetical protein
MILSLKNLSQNSHVKFDGEDDGDCRAVNSEQALPIAIDLSYFSLTSFTLKQLM